MAAASSNLEVLLHGYAVGNAPDRAKGQSAQPRESANMIADDRQSAIVEIAAGFK